MRRIVLIIAGGLGILVLAGSVVLYANRERIARFGIDRTLNTVESQVTIHCDSPALRDSVKADFTALHRRLQDGSVTVTDVRDLAALYYTSTRDDRLEPAEVRTLIDRLRVLARKD